MKRYYINELFNLNLESKLLNNLEVEIKGWIKTNRCNGNFGFLSISDGSKLKNIQVVYKSENINNLDEVSSIRTGAAVSVIGKILLTPELKQPFEIVATEIILLKQSDEFFPLQKKKHTNEFLREISHLRPRTTLFSAIMKTRSSLYKIINDYFINNNYVWVATPIITSNDAEGAGESFKLSKLDDEEFFSNEVSLSVTGQLHAEAYAMAFEKVYSFGPQFRAEKSHTNRHASEFWMLEPEVAFIDMNELMDIMDDMFHYIIKEYRKICGEEVEYFNEFLDTNLINRLNEVENSKINRISYTEAIEILTKAVSNKHKFENNKISWGMDLESEHERYICEEIFKAPTFVYNYPIELKAFYMKKNDDNKTVAGVDLLVPGVGELCGGSQREDDYDKLLTRIKECKLEVKPLEWYLDLRKYGYYKSAGFGLGFERLIMYVTGVNNIRDTIPFARTHGNAKY